MTAPQSKLESRLEQVRERELGATLEDQYRADLSFLLRVVGHRTPKDFRLRYRV